jgi:hypothetical protein
MDPVAAAGKRNSTPFGKPASTLQPDGPSNLNALSSAKSLLAERQIRDTTVYERQLSFRVKSEAKDGQLILHQVNSDHSRPKNR